MSETGAAVGGATIDSLVDGAFEAMEADLGEGGLEALEGGNGTKPGKVTAEEPNDLLEAADGLEEGEELEEAEEAPDVPTRGTQDKPLSVKDMPADRFIKVKIDGEERVVSLREAVDSGIREATFRAKVGQIKELPQQIEALKTEFKEKLTGTKSKVNALLSNPKMLFDFYQQSPEMEAVGLEMAKLFAQQAKADKENPLARQQRQLAAREAKLEQETRARTEAEQREAATRRSTEAQNRRAAELKPAWEEALKETGFPMATQELYDLVGANMNALAQRTGKPPTAADFKSIAVRAIKFLNLKPSSAKPAPPPKREPKVVEKRSSNGKNPHRKGTIDHLLFGVKPVRGL